MALGPEELGGALRRFVERLERERTTLDALNVFPVADGDTGANLLATARAVAEALPGGPASTGEVAAAATRAALLGARGNSGVILSQWLAGFGTGVTGPLDGPALAAALQRAAAAAGGAVARPVAGTMLTVADDLARAAAAVAGGDALAVATAAHHEALASVERTPGLLAVLAERGVVDAGGLGLAELVASVVEALGGVPAGAPRAPTHAPRPVGQVAGGSAGAVGYEITFLRRLDRAGADELRRRLEGVGDSVAVAWDEGTARAHVHCDEAGPAVQAILGWGEVTDLRVEALHVR